MKIKNILVSLTIALVGGFVAVFVYARLTKSSWEIGEIALENRSAQVHYAALHPQNAQDVTYPDFTYAAEQAVHCVVHVKVKSKQRVYSNPFYEFFYGYRPPRQVIPVEGYGSGVIISEDGYIITNNHVIERADEIEVTLNDKRIFTATLVGADPSSDIALLKVDETGLQFLTYGDSENLKVGEWVLAVGNPYNLTSTVTAGIVSAKARKLGIISDAMAIESFIQTDAAVNPGNSGGALVNTRGELVGINTAIASQTGTYSGNSFAVPVFIVQKVVTDLREYGAVQRAMLGITIDAEYAEKNKVISVETVLEEGAAFAAGLKEGDIIKTIDGVSISSYAELQDQLSKYRPNDEVELTIERNKKIQTLKVTLRNVKNTTQLIKNDPDDILGAKFEGINDRERRTLRIRSGVKVKDVGQGKLKEAGVRNGFIITRMNDVAVSSVNDINEVLSLIKSNGRVVIDGVYLDGRVAYYVFAK
ncbi:MAG: trypsin-like peptidase domain-containing protein [Bacteroidales bacterium]|jgi:Do/DeqQ family serine protease|nr:trypsin-like peptidase domain-containing protein [Bacteroidales bacterium]